MWGFHVASFLTRSGSTVSHFEDAISKSHQILALLNANGMSAWPYLFSHSCGKVELANLLLRWTPCVFTSKQQWMPFFSIQEVHTCRWIHFQSSTNKLSCKTKCWLQFQVWDPLCSMPSTLSSEVIWHEKWRCHRKLFRDWNCGLGFVLQAQSHFFSPLVSVV